MRSLLILITILSFYFERLTSQPVPTHTLSLTTGNLAYHATLYFGSKSQPITVLVDSGSDILAVFSNLCTANCIPAIAFNTTASTTFKRLTCGTYTTMTNIPSAAILNCRAQCVSKASSYVCNGAINYGSAALPSGLNYYTTFDQIGFQSTTSGRQKSTFGSIYNQSSFTEGIWGTSYIPSNQILLTYATAETTSIKVYSICTLFPTAYMHIGGIKKSIHATKSATAKINTNIPFWWSILPGQISSMKFNGTSLYNSTFTFGANSVILDSGTNFHFLPTTLLNGIKNILVARCNQLGKLACNYSSAGSVFPYYFNISNINTFISTIPYIAVTFGNATFNSPISNYFWTFGPNMFYLCIMSSQLNGMPMSILGSPFMNGLDVVFDRANAVISLFPVTKCNAANRLLQEEEDIENIEVNSPSLPHNLLPQALLANPQVRNNQEAMDSVAKAKAKIFAALSKLKQQNV